MSRYLPKSVAVVGGGVAGMSAATALAEAGFRVRLLERRSYLGGRASSYLHPGTGEVVDNCQHALFGCCTNLQGFYKRIGVDDQIHWTSGMTMVEPGGRRSELGPVNLPAPLHGLPKLMTAHAFSIGDKLALARAFSAMMRPQAETGESLAVWLKRHGQTRGALNRFWRLVIASALNAELDQISVPYAAKVIRELFMNSAWAGVMGMSRVPLSELYTSVPKFLTDRGNAIEFQSHVEAAEWNPTSRQWLLQTGIGEFYADYVIAALPFEAMGKLMESMQAASGVTALKDKIARHTHWPICSVHLWFDRPITDLPHAVLLDREVHWMYNQSVLQGRPGNYIELVISATRSFAALERKQAIELALSELKEFFPIAREAKVEKVALIKEVRATFGVSPGIDFARPAAVDAPWPQFFLAGDWTATGWPSTMESAARSGHLAAEALCKAEGLNLQWLEPDFPRQGLMRWL